MEQIIAILNSIRPGIDYSACEDLVGEKILTSLELIMLVGKLNDEFDIEIGVSDLRPANFKNVDTILELVHRLEEE